MIINKNIMKIIIDKMALNQWKNKVKNINNQYLNYFEWFLSSGLTINKKNYPLCSIIIIYSYRDTIFYRYVYNRSVSRCYRCKNYHPKVEIVHVGNIPEKYYYSSGLNDRNGYKKN